MIISCPSCSSNFALPSNAIGEKGRKVKCSKCDHVWLAKPVKKSDLDNALDTPNKKIGRNFKASKNIPQKYKEHKIKYLYVASLVILLSIGVIFGALKTPAPNGIVASVMGLENNEGLRLNNFTADSEIVDNKLDFYLEGEIVNLTAEKMRVPLLNVKILSAGNRVMAEDKIALTQEFIEPEGMIKINPEIIGVSGNASKVEISFENWLEASLR